MCCRGELCRGSEIDVLLLLLLLLLFKEGERVRTGDKVKKYCDGEEGAVLERVIGEGGIGERGALKATPLNWASTCWGRV